MANSAVIEMDNINPDNNPNGDGPQHCENESARYWQDCHQLLTLLPKEVWHLIGSSLDNQHVLNLTNSSPFFRDLFLRNRAFHLFEPVLEILIPKLEEYMDTSSANYQEESEVLLKSRQSCKTWKRTIDKKACMFEPDEPKALNLIPYLLSKNFTFKDSSEIDKFLQYFQSSHPQSSNPSPAKYIDLHIRLMEEDYPLLINRISTLLEKYGQHIWTFEVSIMFRHMNPAEFHHKFVKWLKCMPNLQSLLIFCFIPLRTEWNGEQGQLEGRLPLQLKFLRNLAIETFIPPLSDERIPTWSWMERYNLTQLVHLNDNLDFLDITMFNMTDAKILENVLSPLKTLVAQYYCKENELNLSQVFTMLSDNDKFSNTLENLRLSYYVNDTSSGKIQIMRDLFYGRLKLPKLRTLHIQILKLDHLDFLVELENLEELIIDCAVIRSYTYSSDNSEAEREKTELANNQIIKILGYQGKMLESNIWSIFPKLRTITLLSWTSEVPVEFKREDAKNAKDLKPESKIIIKILSGLVNFVKTCSLIIPTYLLELLLVIIFDA